MTLQTLRALAFVALMAANLISFFLMKWDKARAVKGARRIPEKTLFLAAACFGALGGTLGMFLCRHKTRHWYFRLFFPLMMAAQAAVLCLIVLVNS
jgi:uncharacterized membrane protein YsdA (DUF1294 family)